jgi:uncharacterized lipoprotein YddW (UPF0748 family)
MAQVLLRIADTQFWVLADTVEERILETYKRSQVEADIAAIENTLASYPDPSVAEQDLKDVIWLVDNFDGATAARKTRVKALLRDMWAAYEQEPVMFEQAQLRSRLENLQQLLAKMV